MTEKLKLDLSLVLPDAADERDACWLNRSPAIAHLPLLEQEK